ncbi:ribose transport system substrate-binding protein [Anoxybacillus voinovskiensis]|uniref:histidine kinase n=1 Tax=Anoxybacteroides voinovskiense TaxID=230470 RepID=A0A840DI25_9BACL|nr:ATP-binding protein [Anoxybacillus voinovskiensis]MBB4072390.1 ribose transport system substrate-binding protein [Anoxybacillus voinovskiensis]GGJ58239.1 hypothetical protein GCM10008982_04220 [Anoxybacillus voinovskiensis]
MLGVAAKTKSEHPCSELVSKMSHEFRTPLNGIIGFAQLLDMDSSLTSQQREFVHEILNGARHLLQLVNEMLDLSRIETGRLSITYDEVNVASVVEESVKFLQPVAEQKNVKIMNEIADDCYVKADSTRIRQILFNLLENAVKYNKENGSVTITSTCEAETVTIHVQDTGIGIPAEELDDIFQPFYRIKGTNAEGSGIGLALAKQLVQAMNGTIRVDSKLGKGSNFSFTLPAIKKTTHVHPDTLAHSFEEMKRVGAKTLLYIEDRLSNIKLLEEIFAPFANVVLLYATSGEEGLKIAFHEKVDAIFLDLHLPDMHGYDVLEQLKQNEKTRSIPVVAVSANAVPEEIERTLQKGCAGYLTKPLNIAQCFETILQVLS